MSPSDLAARPSWFGALVADVDRAFVVTGADTPGWPHPHPDRKPTEDEYSRCLDQGKYRILDSRVDAWTQVLARGTATVDEVASGSWLDAPRGPDGHGRVRRIVPAAQDALVLDGWFLTVARGGLVHARSGPTPAPDGLQRWVGTPWQ